MKKFPFAPELLDALPEELAELFRSLEIKLLEEICSRLKIADNLNEVTIQDIRALRSHGIDLEEIKKVISKTSSVAMDKLEKLFDDVVARSQAYYTEMITLAQVTAPETLVSARDIEAIKQQTKGDFKNITQSMGFLVDNGRTMLPPAKAYQWALDNAELQIQSSAISYNQAISEAVRQLADSGLKVVNYESGHHNQIDVAVRRAVMTGIVQLNTKYNEDTMDVLGTDLVIVSMHTGARDKGIGPENHKSWQGKIYRWSKKPRTSKGDYPDLVKITGYGSGEGLCGWNCRHRFHPFIEGITRERTPEEIEKIDPPPFEFEGKIYTIYEATQKQREIEASIRKQKKRKAAAIDEKDKTAASIKLRQLNKEYRDFSKAAGLPEQRERMKVLY